MSKHPVGSSKWRDEELKKPYPLDNIGQRVPMFVREGREWMLVKAPLPWRNGYSLTSSVTMSDLAWVLETMDEEQLASLGVRPLEAE